MKRHVDIGANILALVDFPYPVVPIVRCHHENWDGSGYPAGVAGTDIPIGARILSVVDCFDALTSDRPYRRRLSTADALQILLDRRGTMYDPEVVDTFLRIHGEVVVSEGEHHERVEVLQQINRSLQSPPRIEEPSSFTCTGVGATGEVLAFVSLARMTAGEGSVADVLALANNLVRHLSPGASGAIHLVSESGDRLSVANAFGPAAPLLERLSMGFGEKLTGWVASNRHPILNSDAALDLGEHAAQANPPLVSSISVPLQAGETLVGVLTMYSSSREAFSEDLGRVLQMVAPHIATALHAKSHQPGQLRPQSASSRDLKLVKASRRA
jgi:hypothetical protein